MKIFSLAAAIILHSNLAHADANHWAYPDHKSTPKDFRIWTTRFHFSFPYIPERDSDLTILKSQPPSLPSPGSESADEKIADFTFWLALATWALALFTFALFVATFCLYRVATRDSGHAQQASQAAQDAASAAKTQADAVISVEIPILVVVENEFVRVVENHMRYTFKFGNHGRTPAIALETKVDCFVGEELPEHPDYSRCKVKTFDIDRLIAPGHPFDIEETTGMSTEQWEAVLGERTKLWVFGYIRYHDYRNKICDFRFCRQFVGERSQMYPQMPAGQVRATRCSNPLYSGKWDV